MEICRVINWKYRIDENRVHFLNDDTKTVHMTFTLGYFLKGQWEVTLAYYEEKAPRVATPLKICRDELLERGLIDEYV